MYVKAADRLRLLYHLLSRKVVPRGMRAFVLADNDADAERVDAYLWTAAPGEFLPHSRAEHEAATESPVVVGAGIPAAEFHDGLLVSWRETAPSFFGSFAQFVDISGNTAPEIHAARERYKFYAEQGYPLDFHNMAKNSAKS